MLKRLHHSTNWRGLFMHALYALRDNRLRTVMSVAGITLGIAAVIIVQTIGQGGKQTVYQELETFGLRSVWVVRDWGEPDPLKPKRLGTGISEEDYFAIKSGCCPAVDRVSPIVTPINIPKVRNGDSYSDARIYGVGEDFEAINNDDVVIGRGLNSIDVKNRRFVAVVGIKVGEDLFGKYANPVGKEFRLGNYKLHIVGVLSPKSRDFLASIGSAGDDSNNRILLPYNVYQQISNSQGYINTLQAQAVSREEAEVAKVQVIATLERRNGGRFEYKGSTMKKWTDTADRILDSVTWVGIAAASISLFVGGIGIMNIMTTSVVERTREIGVRKAVGATMRDISIQFLLEAAFISLIGGILGMFIGIFVSVALQKITGLTLTPSISGAILALFVSVGVGLLSGYYPARRAALLRPIEALRYE